MPEESLLSRLRSARAAYPRAFWVLFWGLLINSAGASMVWPFLTIFIRQRLGVPLTTVTLLFSLNAIAGLVALSFVGPAVDRFGRRFAMIIGLIAGGLILLAMSFATTLPLWAAAMVAQGVFSPFYRVGSDAMIADMIEPGRRAGAYALLRMINNLGIAIGPAIGGFVAGVSYSLAFAIAAAASLLFVSLIILKVPETLPTGAAARGGGYGPVLRDRSFLAFCGVFVLVTIPAAVLMVLLAVYAKENFAVPEQQYGFIMATNATLVVLLQYRVTRTSQRYDNWRVLALGALFYAVGAGSVALGQGFWAFWLSMVILTFGELLLAPTGSAMAADLAPVDMRGRYMGLYGLTWGISYGLGPVIAGVMNDNLAPVAMWIFAGLAGLAAAAGFAWLGRHARAGPPRSPDRASALSG